MSTLASSSKQPESSGDDRVSPIVGRICLVEDSRTAGHAIRKVLVKEGYQVDYFTGMEIALAALQAQHYDLLITDLNLRVPGADGDDLIRSLRNANESMHRLLPILVLTGDADAQTLVRVFKAGANDYLTKPAQPHELRARVDNLVRLNRTIQKLAQEPSATHMTGTVCYLHPDESSYGSIKATLTELGLSVDQYQTADDALQAVAATGYDYVITDLDLPHEGMQGADFTRALRSILRPERVPSATLLVVQRADQFSLLKVEASGASGFVLEDASAHQIATQLQKQGGQAQATTEADVTSQDETAGKVVEPIQRDAPVQPSISATMADEVEEPHEAEQARVKIRHVAKRPPVSESRQAAAPSTTTETLVGWIITQPWLNIFACVVFAVLAGVGLKFINLSADYRVFFSEENPELIAFDAIERTYAKNFNLLFVISPNNEKVFSNETLQIVRELTEASWKIPFATRVDSITNFQHTWAKGDELEVRDLVEKSGELSYDKLLWIAQTAIAEPLLVNRLVSEKGHVTGINVEVQLPGHNSMESNRVAAYGRELKREFLAKYPDIKMHLSGLVMQNNAFYEGTMRDVERLIPAMYLIVIVLIALLLRSISAMVVVSLIVIASTITAVGLAGWLNIMLTPPSSMSPIIILTLAVANSVHILTIFFAQMRAGSTKILAMQASLRSNLQPVFLTSATTAIGFLSMNFSDAPPFHDLGNIVAMGVLAAFLYSVVLLPSLMLVLPVKTKIKESRLQRSMEPLGNWVLNHRGKLLVLMGLVFPALAAGTLSIEVDDNFVEYFDERYSFRTDADYVQRHLTGLANIEFSVGAEEPGGINEPYYLAKLDDFVQWLRKQEGVVHVNSISDVMKRLNFNMHSNDPSYYQLPKDRKLAAQYLLLYEFSLPRGLDINNQLNLDKSASRVTVTLKNLSNNEQLAIERSASQWLQHNTPSYMHARGASPTIMFANISQRNINSMFMGTAVALLLISAILIFALRSIKVGLISILPNLLPAVMAFGLWGILVGKVGLAVSIVSAMALGIIVDDTVHFLSKYLAERRDKGLMPTAAVKATFLQVGPALIITSVLLITGFMMLSLSGFKINADMGLLTAITILIALIADFLFLPPILIWIEGIKRANTV